MNKFKKSKNDIAKKRTVEYQDDADIAYYAKKLRLKSKKEKGIPKEFYSDGLGEILEFLEDDNDKNYEKLLEEEEAPEEVSQREFQLFPRKIKNVELKIPKGKLNLNQVDNDESDDEENDEEDHEEDDELDEDLDKMEDDNISDSDDQEIIEDEENVQFEDEEHSFDFDDNPSDENNSDSQENLNDGINDTNKEHNTNNTLEKSSVQNLCTKSAPTQKWISKRVQLKRGLSVQEPDQDLSYLDQESDDASNQITQNQHDKSASKMREDMYGRLVDEKGNIIKSDNEAKKLLTFDDVGAVNDLVTKIRGLLNRLTVKTIPFVVQQIEEIYKNHSNNLVARCLFECINNLVVENRLIASQKLCTELVMLISVLHSHVGEEVSGNLLHNLILIFDENFNQLQATGNIDGRKVENCLLLFCLFYCANIIGDQLIYDILNKFVNLFCPKSIEMILFVLKLVGYLLRKDNVSSMKEFILKSQQKAAQFDKNSVAEKKVIFLLESLTHIKNNNQLKMDLSDIQGVVSIDKQAFRNEIKTLYKDLNVSPLPGKYNEILKSNRWYIQSGELLEQSIKRKNNLRQERAIPTFNDKLCKKMQLTTPFRKLIFNTLISCEDYVDCSQNLIQIGKKKHFEVIGVCAHVALSEKQFNAFYVHLFRYLSRVDHSYKRGIMFVVRDKLQEINLLSDRQQSNLVRLTAELIRFQVLNLAILKCIDLKDIDEKYKTLLSAIIMQLFDATDDATLSQLFKKLDKKDAFTISLKLFINMFLELKYKNRLKAIKQNSQALDKIF